MEAKRGLFEVADRHHHAADELLKGDANRWLEGVLALDVSAVAYGRSELAKASQSATEALRAAEDSGHLRTRAAALANLATIMFASGRQADAERYFSLARPAVEQEQEVRLGLLDSYAQLKLACGDLSACERLLHEIEGEVEQSSGRRGSWYERLFRLTRARLLLAQGRDLEALAAIDCALDPAGGHSDLVRLHILRADALIGLSRLEEAGDVMAEIASVHGSYPASVSGEVDRVKGELLARLGRPRDGRRHLERAVRVLSTVGGATARQQAEGALARVKRAAAGDQGGQPGLTDAAAVLELSTSPELLGREALSLLCDLECASGAALVVARNGRPLEVLARQGWSRSEARAAARENGPGRRLPLGEARERRFFLALTPRPDARSHEALEAVRKLVDAAVRLEATKREQRQQAALLPPASVSEIDGVFIADEMLKVAAVARRIASSDLPVLITGETGSGKEVLARLIHAASGRADQTFLAFNCTGLPRDTAESQLFGHRRGAFTDAREEASGIVRTAEGGTLMLDEIGELDPLIQPKLLRFLESGEVQPVGEPQPVAADVRVIAATNASIDTLVKEGRFREDLFYRLNVIRLRIPPLRERREEIPPLVRHFLARYGREMHRDGLELSDEASTALLVYDWPGNVRQLANEIRRLVAMADTNDVIRPADLSPEILVAHRPGGDAYPAPPSPDADALAIRIDQSLAQATEELERAMIRRAFRESGGRVNGAAQLLGLSRKGLFLKRRRLGINTAAMV